MTAKQDCVVLRKGRSDDSDRRRTPVQQEAEQGQLGLTGSDCIPYLHLASPDPGLSQRPVDQPRPAGFLRLSDCFWRLLDPRAREAA